MSENYPSEVTHHLSILGAAVAPKSPCISTRRHAVVGVPPSSDGEAMGWHVGDSCWQDVEEDLLIAGGGWMKQRRDGCANVMNEWLVCGRCGRRGGSGDGRNGEGVKIELRKQR